MSKVTFVLNNAVVKTYCFSKEVISSGTYNKIKLLSMADYFSIISIKNTIESTLGCALQLKNATGLAKLT